MTGRIGLFVVLLLLGASWGATQPLSKLAVSTGHEHFGLIFWQFVFGVILLQGINMLRGKKLPLGPRYIAIYILIAVIGTLIPNSFSFIAVAKIPAGVQSIVISLIPMFALPLALLFRLEAFNWLRLLGVILGAVAILILVGPEASLSGSFQARFILLAAIAPFCYALEGIYVARFGTLDLDPVQLLLGASIVGALFSVPLSLGTGQWIDLTIAWTIPEWSLLGSSILHTVSYTGYFWLVARAGPVFATQSAYLVTGFGVVWSMVLLSEYYSGWIWLALMFMLAGLFLVQPRGNSALEETTPIGDNG